MRGDEMCSSTETKQEVKDETAQELVTANIYFPTFIYQIEKPEFLEAVNRVAEEALTEVRKEKPLHEIYPVHMTNNLYDVPDILPFQYYVGGTAYNLLVEQGYDLQDFETYFSEMWCQEHYKHSGMEQHVHGGGSQFVGFYFLSAPENSSRVVFHDPRPGKVQVDWRQQDMSKITSASSTINFVPRPGLLVFTNAWLPHSFSRHEADEPIRFIHFNIGLRPYFNMNATCSTAEVV